MNAIIRTKGKLKLRSPGWCRLPAASRSGAGFAYLAIPVLPVLNPQMTQISPDEKQNGSLWIPDRSKGTAVRSTLTDDRTGYLLSTI